MKKIVLTIIPILICTIIFTNCKFKVSNKADIADGIYSGTINVTYNESDSVLMSIKEKVTITLKDGKFICIQDVCCDSFGKYIISNKKIIFEDRSFWSVGFDWNLILDGEYDYIFDGKKLKISKGSDYDYYGCDFAYYEYDLTKE